MKSIACVSLLLALALVACSPDKTEQAGDGQSQSSSQQADLSKLSPEEVLAKLLNSQMKENNPGSSYDLLSTSDKQVRTLEQYTRDNDIGAWKAYQDKYSFEIKSVEINGEAATAQVSFTVPDMEIIMSEALGQEKMMAIMAAMQAESEGGEAESMKKADEMIVEAVSAHYQGGKTLPMTTEEQTYNLVKETGGWKIYHGWQAEQAEGGMPSAPQGGQAPAGAPGGAAPPAGASNAAPPAGSAPAAPGGQ